MDIGEEIKKQKEKEQLDKDIDNLRGISKTEISKITEIRQELEQLRKDKEKFIEERKAEVENKLIDLNQRIVDSLKGLAELDEEAVKVVSLIEKETKEATDGILGLFSRVNELIDDAEGLKEQAENTIELVKRVYSSLENKVIENSELEKSLKKEKQKVEDKSKEADAKLAEAENLAYWHKEPGATYKKK